MSTNNAAISTIAPLTGLLSGISVTGITGLVGTQGSNNGGVVQAPGSATTANAGMATVDSQLPSTSPSITTTANGALSQATLLSDFQVAQNLLDPGSVGSGDAITYDPGTPVSLSTPGSTGLSLSTLPWYAYAGIVSVLIVGIYFVYKGE